MKTLTSILLCASLTIFGSHAADARPPKQSHRGHIVKNLPKAHHTVRVSSGRYFVHRGIYYQPHRGRYRIVAAPIGLRITALPVGFISFQLNAQRYFYAAGNYYNHIDGAYFVVEKPAGAPEHLENTDTNSDEKIPTLFAYPANGQNQKLQRTDKKSCQNWANDQHGVDAASDFRRAYAACLEGRGYTVK